MSCKNSRSNCKNYWTRVLLDRALHLGALRFYLLGKRLKFEWNDLCEKAFQELKRMLTSAPIPIVPERGHRYTVFFDASKNGLGCILMQLGKILIFVKNRKNNKFSKKVQRSLENSVDLG